MNRLALILAGVAINASADPKPPTHITERQLLASVLVMEAGGEIDPSTGHSRKAMQAVWEVIWQRAKNRRLSPVGVVTQRKQFSCLNHITAGRAIATAQRHPHWRHAWGIVGSPPVTNITKGADHYHADWIKDPYWADPNKKTVTLGRHTFYKLRP